MIRRLYRWVRRHSGSEYSQYLRSPQWAAVKKAYYRVFRYYCKWPGCKRRDHLQLHHPYYKGLIFNEAGQLDQLRSVCPRHHKAAEQLRRAGKPFPADQWGRPIHAGLLAGLFSR